ncbi:hypothetical protein ACQP04_29005 [Pseudonocardia halophobica]|uniref:hypothetical protein n=1 Tax=Pseudonocardia halophobica TaxID=29401 RepID=UPI003D93064D
MYGGRDPITKQRITLTEVIPPGPKARREAELVRNRLLLQVAERRNPKSSATIDQLLERYLEQFQDAPNTLDLYRTHVRNHISPCLGSVKVGRLDAEILDSFYAELRRRRRHCSRKRLIDHRVLGEHDCDDRCRPPECKPLTATTIRHIHFILSGAYKKGRPMGVGEGEPHYLGRAAGCPEAEPAAAVGRAGSANHQRGLVRPRLGRHGLDGDDDGRAAR